MSACTNANARNSPYRLCAGGGNSGHECRRARRPVKGLCEIARLVDDGLPSHHLAAIGLSLWLILIHIAEITVWRLFYFWQGCMPDAESAFYFAGVT
jgi:hypothetical protein